MRYFNSIIIIFNVFILSCINLYSFDLDSNLSKNFYGVNGNLLYSMHKADFRSFPGVPSCCPSYQKGNNVGYLINLLYLREISKKFRFGTKLGYSSFGSPLVRLENVLLAGNVNGVFEHKVDTYLSDVGFEPLIQYNLFNNLWLNGSYRLSYLTTKQFSQVEQIVSPGNGLFNNGQSVRNEVLDMQIPQSTSLLHSINLGLSFDLPLNFNASFLMSPELKYTNIFNELVTNLDWSINNVSLGINLLWRPEIKPEIIKELREIEIIDTIKIESDKLIAGFYKGVIRIEPKIEFIDNIELTTKTTYRTDTIKILIEPKIETPMIVKTKAFGVNERGEEFPLVKVIIEEFNSTIITPLLNYVFFEEGQAEIPHRYNNITKTEFDNFNIDSINSDEFLDSYYHLLNIIGKRLQKSPKSQLTIIGCNSDFEQEANNIELSKKRALNVLNYFVYNLGLDSNRFKIEVRNLPLKSANKFSRDGQQENRRVELITNDFSITAPIFSYKTTVITNPETIRFKNQIISDKEIKYWGLSAYQSSQMLKQYKGGNNYLEIIDWELNKEKLTHPKTNEKLIYNLKASDGEQDLYDEDSIEVKQVTIKSKKINKINDKEIIKLNLIIFDVSSSKISENNKQIVNIIKEYIKENSEVSIYGYTDRLGNKNYNNKLAEDRAKSTLKELGKINLKQIGFKGNSTLYNPDLPEGRLYNRTVEITIETPIK